MTEAPLCGDPHPDSPEVTCDKHVPCYYFHASRTAGISWGTQPDPPPKERTTKQRAEIDKMADRARNRGKTSGNSVAALKAYEPYLETAKGRVLDYLHSRANNWVDAVELTTEEVGGFAGTRRLRELREEGWEIETRPSPGAPNVWQHRLVQ
jgi:hypothetical protein